MKDALTAYVLYPLLVALGTLLVAAIGYGTAWLKRKSKAAWADALIDRAHDLVLALVQEQAQALDKARGPDGKLSLAEAKAAKAEVASKFFGFVDDHAADELAAALKIPIERLGQWLDAKIEQAVRADKAVDA